MGVSVAEFRSKNLRTSRAIVAVGNSVLTIVWHLLSDPDAGYHDIGADFYHSRIATRRREHDLVRQLERLTGKPVTLQPAA
jgi:transposase